MNSRMRALSLLALGLYPGIVESQTQPKLQSVVPPSEPKGVGKTYIFVAPQPQSLQELTAMSSLIVEGVVKKVMPSRGDSKLIETDSIIQVNRILKGAAEGSEIAISQIGGTVGGSTTKPMHYAIVQQNERYILCLIPDARTTVPPIEGMKRYTVTGGWSGLMLFSADDKMHTGTEFTDGSEDHTKG